MQFFVTSGTDHQHKNNAGDKAFTAGLGGQRRLLGESELRKVSGDGWELTGQEQEGHLGEGNRLTKDQGPRVWRRTTRPKAPIKEMRMRSRGEQRDLGGQSTG